MQCVRYYRGMHASRIGLVLALPVLFAACGGDDAVARPDGGTVRTDGGGGTTDGGAGGTDSGGGDTDSGGIGDPGTFPCGGSTCDTADEQCCATRDADGTFTYACDSAGRSCSGASIFRCDGAEDCGSGEVCCAMFSSAAAPVAACADAASCPTPLCRGAGECAGAMCCSGASLGWASGYCSAACM